MVALWLFAIFVWAAPTLVLASGGGAPDPAVYAQLQELIRTTPVEQFTLEKFKQIYQNFDDAPSMLKTILGEAGHGVPEKSRRLGELRKFYDWSIQAEYGRDNNVIIENTNQGKDNGARSDLDATSNVLELAGGSPGQVRDRAVKGLQRYHRQRYSADGFRKGSETVDVSLFNGDAWLPDWRDGRMSYQEFRHKLIGNVYDIRRQPGAYYVPGAHKEQAHDRALKEGHTIHIGWDFVNNMPAVNGLPIVFDADSGRVMQLEVDPATGKIRQPQTTLELVEYTTSEAAKLGVVKRYEGISELHGPDKWRRSFGNLVQNWYESLTHTEPISRNKYFIERIVDQAINRTTNVNGTYVELEGSKADRATKQKWKKAFIERAFGVSEGSQRFNEIKSVLDRSAQIQIDYKAQLPFNDRVTTYYAEEIREVRERLGGDPGVTEAEILHQAEAEFVRKQRSISIEGGLKVIEHTFGMELTAEGIRRNTHDFASPEVATKVMTERGVELALFLDMIESAPMEPAERTRLRERVVEAIPTEARPLALRMAELAGLKMDLMGREHMREMIYGERSYVAPSQLLAEVEADMRRLVGSPEAAPRASRGEVLRYIDGLILSSLGPVQGADYLKAREVSNRGLQAKYAGIAYWNEIKAQADLLWGTMTALSMVNAYQQHCADQVSWNDDCIGAMGGEGFYQILFMLPIINTGLITKDGLDALGRGDTLHGAVGVGLGLASIPAVAARMGISGAVAIKAYILIMTTKLGVAVTYGYAVQLMENDFAEQAFKARPEAGKQASPYDYPTRPTVFRSDPPTFPILADVIKVDADRWSIAQRGEVARGMFSADIQAELLELGVDPTSDAWDSKRNDLAVRYGQLLPYTQRMGKIFETFHPRVESKIAELLPDNPELAQDYIGVDVCMEVKRETIEKKYAEPPGVWDQIRFWASRGQERAVEVAAAWGKCVSGSVKEDEVFLRPVFEEYVDSWFNQQSFGYRLWSRTDERRESLVKALMNEYVVHRHLKEKQDQANLMAEARNVAQGEGERRLKVLSALMHAEGETRNDLGQRLSSSFEKNQGSGRNAFDVKPEVVLEPPPFAVRFGSEGQVDFEARGRAYAAADGKGPGANDWEAILTSEISAVTIAEPANLLRTAELEQELADGRGEQAKRFVTIEEKVIGELKNGSGEILATDQTAVTHYEVLEWRGELTVEVRAAGEATKDLGNRSETYPYSGAAITVSGPSSTTGVSEGIEWAGDRFQDLAPGAYAIRVEPREGDDEHAGAEAESSLIDFTVALGAGPGDDEDLRVLSVARNDPADPNARMVLVTWKDRDSIMVVLPYGPQPEDEAAENDEGRGSGDGAETDGETGGDDGPEGSTWPPDDAGADEDDEDRGAERGVIDASSDALEDASSKARAGCSRADALMQLARAETEALARGTRALEQELDEVAEGASPEFDPRQARILIAEAELAAEEIALLRQRAGLLREALCSPQGTSKSSQDPTEISRQARVQLASLRRSLDGLRELYAAVAPALGDGGDNSIFEARHAELWRRVGEIGAMLDLVAGELERARSSASELESIRDRVAALGGRGAGEDSERVARIAQLMDRAERAIGSLAGCPTDREQELEEARRTLQEVGAGIEALGSRLNEAMPDPTIGAEGQDALANVEALLAVSELFVESIENRVQEAVACKTGEDAGGASEGWATGQREDDPGGGWAEGARSDEVDPCRGPRPAYQAALQQVASALRAQDLDALLASVGQLKPECPGDAAGLTALRDQAVRLAQQEARDNEAGMRSAVGNAKARARRNGQAWASALGSLEDVLTTIQRQQAETSGQPAGSGSTTPSGTTNSGATSSGAPTPTATDNSAGPSCLVDSHTQIDPEVEGIVWEYYVQEAPIPGAPEGMKAYKVFQTKQIVERPTIPGSKLHGPYSSVGAAEATLNRLCPPSQRATDSIRWR